MDNKATPKTTIPTETVVVQKICKKTEIRKRKMRMDMNCFDPHMQLLGGGS